VTGEERFITIPRFCSFNPVTDDMAFCHPSIQKGDGKLRITDAENAWFVRVDSVKNMAMTLIWKISPFTPRVRCCF
jgi:hypothetical protein